MNSTERAHNPEPISQKCSLKTPAKFKSEDSDSGPFSQRDKGLQDFLEFIHKNIVCLGVVIVVIVATFIIPYIKKEFFGVDGLCLSRSLIFQKLKVGMTIYNSQYSDVSILINKNESIQEIYLSAKLIIDSIHIQEGSRIYYSLDNPFLLSILAKSVGKTGIVFINNPKTFNSLQLVKNIEMNLLEDNIELTTSSPLDLYPINYVFQSSFQSVMNEMDKDTLRVQYFTTIKQINIDKNLKFYKIDRKRPCSTPSVVLAAPNAKNQLGPGIYKVVNASSQKLPWEIKTHTELVCTSAPRLIQHLSLRFTAEQTAYERITLIRRSDKLEPALLPNPFQFQGILTFIASRFSVNSIYFNHDNPYLLIIAGGLQEAAKKRSAKIFIDSKDIPDMQLMRKNLDFNLFSHNVVIGEKNHLFDVYQPQIGLAIIKDISILKIKNNLKGMKNTHFLLTLNEEASLPKDKQFSYSVKRFDKNTDCTDLPPKIIKGTHLKPGNYLIDRKVVFSEKENKLDIDEFDLDNLQQESVEQKIDIEPVLSFPSSKTKEKKHKDTKLQPKQQDIKKPKKKVTLQKLLSKGKSAKSKSKSKVKAKKQDEFDAEFNDGLGEDQLD